MDSFRSTGTQLKSPKVPKSQSPKVLKRLSLFNFCIMDQFRVFSTLASTSPGTMVPYLLQIKTKESIRDVPCQDVTAMIDVSGSMASVVDKIRALLSALATGLSTHAGSSLEIMTFSNRVKHLLRASVVPVGKESQSTWLRHVLQSVSGITIGGSTNTMSAVEELLRSTSRKIKNANDTISIMVTDGEPTTGIIDSKQIAMNASDESSKLSIKAGWQLMVVGLGAEILDENAAIIGQCMLGGSLYEVVSSVDDIPVRIGEFLGDPVLSTDVQFEYI